MHLFITKRLYWLVTGLILLFVSGYFMPLLYAVAQPLAIILGLLILIDIGLLFFTEGRLVISRNNNDRFSNGDENEITIAIKNRFRFKLCCTILDELPLQFQKRDLELTVTLPPNQAKILSYTLRPFTRGLYAFGNINVLATTMLQLISRKIVCEASSTVKVYPSFIKLHQYELMAISRQLYMPGQKRVRKVGNSQEFDTIKDYVGGDDPRHINWSATAKKGHLMTNHFIDERSQNIYCIIDKSRSMKMPFDQMTLLDYAINASLVMSDVSLKKGDKAGLLTFEDNVDAFVKAASRNVQLYHIIETLYHQQTSFKEPDIAAVYNYARKNINERSLFLFFTNFESIHSLNRQLQYLRLINREHLLVVIYFRNTEVDKLLAENATGTREIYDQSIAYQMLEEKRLIGDALQKAGILSLYTAPQNLNVNIINKYIEIKAKRML